jgi:hypothetical protein
MIKLLLNELGKLFCLLVAIISFIYLSERHIEYAGNQFLLEESTKMLFNQIESKYKQCLLYPGELCKFKILNKL